MALGLVIVDENTHFSITYSTGITDRIPKNALMLRRVDEKFSLLNGSDINGVVGPINFTYADVTTPSVADADALEAALHPIIFV